MPLCGLWTKCCVPWWVIKDIRTTGRLLFQKYLCYSPLNCLNLTLRTNSFKLKYCLLVFRYLTCSSWVWETFLLKTYLSTMHSENDHRGGWEAEEHGKSACGSEAGWKLGMRSMEGSEGGSLSLLLLFQFIPSLLTALSREFHRLFLLLLVILHNSSSTDLQIYLHTKLCMCLGRMYLTQAWGSIHIDSWYWANRSQQS